MTFTTKTISALAIAGISLTALVGCSSQSTADACESLEASLRPIATEMVEGTSAASADTDKLSDLLNTVAKKYDEAAGKINNSEVREAADKLTDATVSMADLYKDADGDFMNLDSEKIGEITTTMTDASEKLASVCGTDFMQE